MMLVSVRLPRALWRQVRSQAIAKGISTQAWVAWYLETGLLAEKRVRLKGVVREGRDGVCHGRFE